LRWPRRGSREAVAHDGDDEAGGGLAAGVLSGGRVDDGAAARPVAEVNAVDTLSAHGSGSRQTGWAGVPAAFLPGPERSLACLDGPPPRTGRTILPESTACLKSSSSSTLGCPQSVASPPFSLRRIYCSERHSHQVADDFRCVVTRQSSSLPATHSGRNRLGQTRPGRSGRPPRRVEA